ncbi:TerD family protein [Streptomyces sp. NPDC001985]|uniref:TerD family protein n=1 Tax=Streptomyces sp. NPDC001985 TaxID=3154406 RepID=UPI0033261A1B
MGQMIKGGNCVVPSVPLRVVVRHDSSAGAPALDVMTLLLDSVSGRMRGPHDLVSSGRPVHPSGAVRHGGGGGGTHWIEFDPAAVEHPVDRVVLAGTTPGGVLAALTDPVVEVFAPDGESVARYPVTGAGTETAFVFGEFYRRAGGWKFRAIGQGYASGAPGLTADYGSTNAPPAPAGRTPPAPPAPVVPPVAGQVAMAPLTPVPDALPGAVPSFSPVWSFGPVFAPFVSQGLGTGVVDTRGAVPPGPVLVEAVFRGEDFHSVCPLGRNNKDEISVICGMDDYRGGAPVQSDGNRALRLKVETGESWTVTVKPLAAARRLEGTLTGAGSEVFLHTGGPVDLAVEYRGDENLIAHYYEIAGLSGLPEDPENLINEIGARRVTLPLPAGPLLVWFEYAEGPWTITCGPVR